MNCADHDSPGRNISGRESPSAATLFLFDLDGTLLDSRRAVVAAVAEGMLAAYRALSLPEPEPDRGLLGEAMGLPADRYFRSTFDPGTVPAGLRDEFVARYADEATQAELAALERGETELYPGVEETLGELKRRGHGLGLFSNSFAPYFRGVFEAHALGRFFADSLCLGEATASGAARDKTGLVRVLARGAERTVVVGDRGHDIAAGRACGARTVGCRYGFGSREEFGDADWMIDVPGDLLFVPPAEASGVP